MKLADPTLLKSQCLADGAWVGDGIDAIENPATGALIAKVPRFGVDETVRAIEAAEKAFGPWAKTLPKERAKILRRWFDLIVANRDDLALIMTSEQGKPLAEARGEIDYARRLRRVLRARRRKRVYGEIIPDHRADARILVLKQPIGVVAAITPWNFPAAMITRKVAPALAAGCTVVVKPRRADAADGAGAGRARRARRHSRRRLQRRHRRRRARSAGDADDQPAVRIIAFTGSTEVGKLLMRQAAPNGEEGRARARRQRAVHRLRRRRPRRGGRGRDRRRNSATSGQTCVCANRIFVQDGVYDAFAEKLAEAVAKLKVGDGDRGRRRSRGR